MSGSTRVLDSVSLEVRPGSRTIVTGESGSGKSTLLRLLVGIEVPTEGTVLLFGTDVKGARPAELRRSRRTMNLGFVQQTLSLFEDMTVSENLAFALELQEGADGPDRRARIEGVATGMRVADHLREYPASLAPGVARMAELARALVTRPNVVVCDDVFAGLDPGAALSVQEALVRLPRSTAIVVATADETRANRLASDLGATTTIRMVRGGPPMTS